MAHVHEGDQNYYLDQLCTIGVCAALGGMCILLYVRNALGLLADPFRLAVLAGGIALVLVTLVRGVTLWISVGRTRTSPHEHHHPHEHEHAHDHGQHAHHAHDHEHAHHHHHSEACDHEHAHDHGHAHHHDHEQHHTHDHDHGHSHDWNPIRYIFLLIPIVLFLLGIPSADFSSKFSEVFARFEAGKLGKADFELLLVGRTVDTLGLQIDKGESDKPLNVVRVVRDGPAEKAGVKANDLITTITLDTDEDGKPLNEPETFRAHELSLPRAAQILRGKPKTLVKLGIEREGEAKPLTLEMKREVVIQNLGFKELDRAAADSFTRQAYEGMTVRLNGQFVPQPDDETKFSLMRVKITCCGADAIALNVIIVVNEKVRDLKHMQWVEVTGQVTFQKRRDRNEFVPIVQVASQKEGIVPTDPQPFLQ